MSKPEATETWAAVLLIAAPRVPADRAVVDPRRDRHRARGYPGGLARLAGHRDRRRARGELRGVPRAERRAGMGTGREGDPDPVHRLVHLAARPGDRPDRVTPSATWALGCAVAAGPCGTPARISSDTRSTRSWRPAPS